MLLTPKAAVLRHQSAIKAHQANAVQALRVADAKFAQAAAENTHVHDCIDPDCFLDAQNSARVFADMLADTATPTIPARVFRTIANYENENPRNADETPHVQGAILAIGLAERCLAAMLDLADQPDGLSIEKPYQAAYAALCMVRNSLGVVTSVTFLFDHEDVLDAILAGKQRSVRGSKRRLAVAA